jgi:hypothetical protein
MQKKRAKPPKATPKPVDSQPIGTPKPPQGSTKATLRPPQSYPKVRHEPSPSEYSVLRIAHPGLLRGADSIEALGIIGRLRVAELELAGRHFRNGTEAGPVGEGQGGIGRGKNGEA